MSTSSELLATAGNNISAQLGLPEGAVTIGTGDGASVVINENNSKTTNIAIGIKGIGADLDRAGAEKKILAALHQIPEVNKVLQTVYDPDLAKKLTAELQKLAESTTGLDPHILKWSGFAPKIAEQGAYRGVDDHAIVSGSNDYGIETNIKVPVDGNTDGNDLAKKIEATIKERLPAIKEELTTATVKYITQNLQHEGKSEADIAQAIEKTKADMAKLDFNIHLDNNIINISISSPEQTEAVKKTSNKWLTADNADALKASNPLSALSNIVLERDLKTNPDAAPQLNKALSRAILFGGGEKAMEVFPLIAGRRDIASLIAKEAKKFPEKEAEFKNILASDLFKKHFGDIKEGEAGVVPSAPMFKKDHTKPDTIELWINDIAKDKIKGVIEAIAAHQPKAQQAAPPPIAETSIAATAEQKPSSVITDVINYFSHGKAANDPNYNAANSQQQRNLLTR